jgi:hypothetical protein
MLVSLYGSRNRGGVAVDVVSMKRLPVMPILR